MKRKILTLTLSMMVLFSTALPVCAAETNGYVTDADGNSFSLTPPQSEEEKTAFGYALMEEGIIRIYQDAKIHGRYFDPEYYAANNPDVVAAFGDEPWVFYYHYRKYGINEGRLPYEGGTSGHDGIANWDLTELQVVIKMLARQAGISEEKEWKLSYGDNIPWYATNAGIEAKIAEQANN